MLYKEVNIMSEKTNANTPEELLTEETPAAEALTDVECAAANVSLRQENEQLLTRLQRLQADFDNYRKRLANEKKEWFTQAVSDIVRELLPVLDNLERAKGAAGTVDSLTEGVDLVYKQLLSVLEKQGLLAIEPCGTEFDPNCHHAIMQVECDQEANTVVEELQKGYLMKDRVIRPSMVKVAK